MIEFIENPDKEVDSRLEFIRSHLVERFETGPAD